MKNGFVDDRAMNAAAKEILAEYKMDYEPTTYVEKLSVAQIQMLEIIKAVRKNADIIIMDEPTSSLSEEEANKLFTIIKDMTARSVSIIYISHRLEEILKLADKITVLRDGEYIETVDAALVTKNRLIELMVGRSLDQVYPKEEVPIRDTVLKVENLCSAGVFKNISFEVHKGEILGISGLMGAGRSEIMRAIFGMDPCDSGTIRIHGEQVILKSPADAINKKIAMVSEDRKEYGLILCRSIRENISLPNLKKCFKGLFISTRKELLEAQTYESSLGIKCSNLNATVETLSGGNQQKVVLAKWLQSEPEILILDEPTRGIDVGAKFEIYKLMVELAKQGMAIIMVSSELPEIMGMSDRILVISNGQITGEYSRNEIQAGNVTQEELLSNAFKM